MKNILICLPIKNEEKILKKNVGILVNYLNKKNWDFSYQIVLTINGSNDNSINIAKNLSNKYKEIDYLELKDSGKGRAIKYCFDNLSKENDILVYMDADLAVDLNDFYNLIKPIKEKKADFVIGSRLMADSKTNRSKYRDLLSRFYNSLTKIFFKHNLKDFQCGFKAIKKDSYKKIRPKLKNDTWFFDTEWIILSLYNNINIQEIAVNWKDNRYQIRRSSVKTIKLSINFLINLIKLKLKNKKIY